ncbi:MAG: flagellar motor protein MotB [Planctomycetota bacterium]
MRKLFALVCLGYLMFASACATRYQDLLRDRDSEIRDLQARLASSRAENEELRRLREDAEKRLASASVAPAEASAEPRDSDLSRVQDQLPELDVRRKHGRISIGIDNTVTFDSGSASVKGSAASILGRVADVLRTDFGSRRIYVEGHTDTDPIRRTKGQFRDNRHLSVERADAVARWLIDRGNVPESRVAVVGYGPHEPRASGASDADKSRNRRVEIVVGEDVAAR